MSEAVSGVNVAGLKTTVLPETSAGAIFQIGMAIGKFHGVMIADRTDRLLQRVAEIVRQLGWNRLAGDSSGFAGKELDDIDRALNLAARFARWSSLLRGSALRPAPAGALPCGAAL